MKVIRCPNCKKEIIEVFVMSECTQNAYLEDKEITDYGDSTIGETLKIECGNVDCMHDITEYLKKKGVSVR
jgi:hypothetical protein